MAETKSVEFKVPDEEAVTPATKEVPASKGRNSSFFNKLSQSFRRSEGERGADVETLRGINGADFEGYAMVTRGGGVGSGCGCFRHGDSAKERLILIKGPFCFVFKNEDAAAPKYAISFAPLKAHTRKPSHGLTVVTLETELGDVEYEMRFSEEDPAQAFAVAANKQAAKGVTEEARKRLGHGHLIQRSKSVKYAEKIAIGKISDQPEKKEKLTAEELVGLNPVIGIGLN
jgi:hypothetical protein